MNMGGIIKDSLRYPFSDWKKILILGFIMLFSTVSNIFSFQLNIVIILLFLIGFLISFFVLGYLFKIMKSSLNGSTELPKFNSWTRMFKDGIKIYIVQLVYVIPVLLLLLVYPHTLLALTRDPTPLTFIPYLEVFIRGLIGGTIFASYFWFSVSILIMSLYLILTMPIIYLGLANMVKNNGKLRFAFSFREIFHKITNNGLKNFLIWYLAIIIPFFIIYLIYLNLYGIYQYVGFLLLQIMGFSYLAMYLYRLVALFHNSE